MKTAITGGTGFIGGKLAEKLSNEGYDIRCLVRNPDKATDLKRINADIFHGDLSDRSTLPGFLEGIDTVFHIAAYVSDWGKKEDFYRVNVEATRDLLDQALYYGVKRFIHISSSTVVWRTSLTEIHDLREIDENYPYPEIHYDNYNETKEISERLVKDYNDKNGLQTVVLRPSNVWGEGDNVILLRVVEAARKGILFPIGYNKKNVTPCNVNNLIHAMLLAAKSEKAPGNIYFINDGMKIDYFRFLSDQLRAAGIDWKPRITLPYSLMYSIAFFLETIYRLTGSEKPPVLTRFAVSALAGSRSYSIENAKRDLGYEPVVSYEQGLSQLESWLKSRKVSDTE